MKNILITGGAGYIGSHAVLETLKHADMRPVVVDDLSTGHAWLVPEGVAFHQGSVHDRGFMADVCRRERIDAVMHFAARSLVAESVRDPLMYFDQNCGGALALLSVLRECGIDKLVFSSTAAVFGDPLRIPIDESHPCAPVNPYGRSKLLIEQMLAELPASQLRSVSLRYFNAAGADPGARAGEAHATETHLIPLVLDAALGKRDAITIAGTDYPTRDGSCVRDFIHVSDLARAHIAALRYLFEGGATAQVNLGSGDGITVREVIEAVKRVTKAEFRVIEGPRRAGDPHSLVASCRHAEALLAFRAERSSIDVIVEDAWRWHQHLVRRAWGVKA